MNQESCDFSRGRFKQQYNATNSSQYYNIARGGEGHTCEPWNKGIKGPTPNEKQLKALQMGQKLPASDKLKQQLSARRKNCEVSSDTRQLLSERAKGKKIVNNGTVCKAVLIQELEEYLQNGWKLGRPLSEESKKRMTTKFRHTMQTKSHEEEQARKNKLSLAFKGRIWVTNDTISKQILPEELPTYLNNGFRKGRLLNTTKKKFND